VLEHIELSAIGRQHLVVLAKVPVECFHFLPALLRQAELRTEDILDEAAVDRQVGEGDPGGTGVQRRVGRGVHGAPSRRPYLVRMVVGSDPSALGHECFFGTPAGPLLIARQRAAGGLSR
jgi:hypothetical protein